MNGEIDERSRKGELFSPIIFLSSLSSLIPVHRFMASLPPFLIHPRFTPSLLHLSKPLNQLEKTNERRE